MATHEQLARLRAHIDTLEARTAVTAAPCDQALLSIMALVPAERRKPLLQQWQQLPIPGQIATTREREALVEGHYKEHLRHRLERLLARLRAMPMQE